MIDLLAVGEVMLDVVASTVEPRSRIHAPIDVRAGGSAVNAALAAAANGASAAVVGRVGDDDAGRVVAAALDHAGVHSHLATDDTLPTGVSVMLPDGTGVTDRGANRALVSTDIALANAAAALLVSGYALLQDDSGPAALSAINEVTAELVAVDAGAPGLLRRFGAASFMSIDGVDVLLADDEEAAVLTNGSPDEAARELGRRYRTVCIKCGHKGVVASNEGQIFTAAPQHVISGRSPVGAGDAFAGVLLSELVRAASFDDALQAACDAGAAVAAERALAT